MNNKVIKPIISIGFNKKGKIDSFLNVNKIKNMNKEQLVELANRLYHVNTQISKTLYLKSSGLDQLSPEIVSELTNLVNQGRSLQAVKNLRDHVKGLGLKDAKQYVDFLI